MLGLAARVAEVIRVDALWVSVQPMDMRAGVDQLLTQVVKVFGEARAHHGYLFANARASRIKLVVHDGFGVWCAARRPNKGSFIWASDPNAEAKLELSRKQFDALVIGLPWQRLERMQSIRQSWSAIRQLWPCSICTSSSPKTCRDWTRKRPPA